MRIETVVVATRAERAQRYRANAQIRRLSREHSAQIDTAACRIGRTKHRRDDLLADLVARAADGGAEMDSQIAWIAAQQGKRLNRLRKNAARGAAPAGMHDRHGAAGMRN